MGEELSNLLEFYTINTIVIHIYINIIYYMFKDYNIYILYYIDGF